MFRMCSIRWGGAVKRNVATTATAANGVPKPKGKRGRAPGKKAIASASHCKARSAPSSAQAGASPEEGRNAVYASARPAYMSEKREKEVLSLAERMQGRDLSGEVPVASFAYEIIQKHPSVRTMGLRERMDFLCTRWTKLPEKKRLEYLNDPLKGLL